MAIQPITARSGYCYKKIDTGTNTDTLTSLPVPERYLFSNQFYLVCFNKRSHYTYLWLALSVSVTGCFSCKAQDFSQSTVLLDLATSMLHVYWLTDADEINSFVHLIPNFDMHHFWIVLRQFSQYLDSIEVRHPAAVTADLGKPVGMKSCLFEKPAGGAPMVWFSGQTHHPVSSLYLFLCSVKNSCFSTLSPNPACFAHTQCPCLKYKKKLNTLRFRSNNQP